MPGVLRYIFFLHLTLGYNILRKDNCKQRRDTFKFRYLVRLILETLRYVAGNTVEELLQKDKYVNSHSSAALTLHMLNFSEGT